MLYQSPRISKATRHQGFGACNYSSEYFKRRELVSNGSVLRTTRMSPKVALIVKEATRHFRSSWPTVSLRAECAIVAACCGDASTHADKLTFVILMFECTALTVDAREVLAEKLRGKGSDSRLWLRSRVWTPKRQ